MSDTRLEFGSSYYAEAFKPRADADPQKNPQREILRRFAAQNDSA